MAPPAADARETIEPVAHKVVRHLQERITCGAYRPGTYLPSQRSLAAEFDISRSSLREALSVLETLGLVSGGLGQRTRVLGANGSASPDRSAVRWRYASRYSGKDVYELRLLLEARAARLAAARMSAETVAALTLCLCGMKDAIRQGDLAAAAQKDFDFHDIIVTLSGNRLFKEIHEMNRAAILETQKLPLVSHEHRWEPVDEHEQVLRALEQRDPDGAAYLMQLHIIRAAERIGIKLKP